MKRYINNITDFISFQNIDSRTMCGSIEGVKSNEVLMKMNLYLMLVGCIAGFFSAVLGIGGGVIMVPALNLFSGYEIKKAIGTSLAAIIPIALVAAISHYILKSSDIKLLVVLFVVSGSVIGAKFGVALANKLGSRVLKRLFALLLLFVGLKLINLITLPTETISHITAYPILVILGLVAGSASGLLGIGGGVIIVPALNLFFGLTIHEAIVASLTIMPFVAFAGAVFHKKFDNIDTRAIKFLVPTALIAAVFGAIFANSLPADTLKTIFGIFLILCSIILFIQAQNTQPVF